MVVERSRASISRRFRYLKVEGSNPAVSRSFFGKRENMVGQECACAIFAHAHKTSIFGVLGPRFASPSGPIDLSLLPGPIDLKPGPINS